ncbi:MAG: hypothetical protein GY835_05130, partial [bacterium]|nr:hypothetical protein [bacterium]
GLGLLGEPAQGNWTLRVQDLVAKDAGTLNRWSLDLDLAARPPSMREDASSAGTVPDQDRSE